MKAKVIAILALFGIAVNAISSEIHATLMNGDHADQQFSNFISRHARHYRSLNEFRKRREIFRKNYDVIENFNKHAHENGYVLEANKFTDMTDDEFSKVLGLKNVNNEEGTVGFDFSNFDFGSNFETFRDNFFNNIRPSPTP